MLWSWPWVRPHPYPIPNISLASLSFHAALKFWVGSRVAFNFLHCVLTFSHLTAVRGALVLRAVALRKPLQTHNQPRYAIAVLDVEPQDVHKDANQRMNGTTARR